MKKIIAILLLAFVSSTCITACTEEDVTPNSQVVNTAGKAQDPA